jgi:hypothetical protein
VPVRRLARGPLPQLLLSDITEDDNSRGNEPVLQDSAGLVAGSRRSCHPKYSALGRPATKRTSPSSPGSIGSSTFSPTGRVSPGGVESSLHSARQRRSPGTGPRRL